MTPHEAFHAARELVATLLTGLAEIRKGDERQEFLDRASIALLSSGQYRYHEAYDHAEKLWREREKRRGKPSERERVVRYLNRLGAPIYTAVAESIKAGKHLEPYEDLVGEKFSG